MKSRDGKVIVSKWKVWVLGVLFIAALACAIAIPLSMDTEPDEVVKEVVLTGVDFHDPFAPEFDPFELLRKEGATRSGRVYDVDRLEKKFAALSIKRKLGQLSQWSLAHQTGPDSHHFPTSMEGAAATGQMGSALFVLSFDEGTLQLNNDLVESIQRAALFDSDGKERPDGVPVAVAFDVIHGLMTIFPVNLGMAASWDVEAVGQTHAYSTREAKALGIRWTFNPMVDISRDARWGRSSEGSGEDPFLVSAMAVGAMKAYQDNGIAACVKHVAGYGGAEAGKDYHTVPNNEVTLFNDYYPTYRALAKAGVWSAMASFNTLNGIPSHANKYLMNDLLRGLWGFTGLLIGDSGGIREVENHRRAGSLEEASMLALDAGIDMSMGDGSYVGDFTAFDEEEQFGILKYAFSTRDALRHKFDGTHSISELIDLACKRVLAFKEKLGLFDDWGQKDLNVTALNPTEEGNDIARNIAEISTVLLKNGKAPADAPLPLKRDARILLVGAAADDPSAQLGSWSFLPLLDLLGGMTREESELDTIVTYKQGLEDFCEGRDCSGTRADGCCVDYLLGYKHYMFDEIVDEKNENKEARQEVYDRLKDMSKEYDYILFVGGEDYLMNGEGASRANLDLPYPQKELFRQISKNKGDNTKLVLVLNIGRPNTIEEESETADAIIVPWASGSLGGRALPNVLFGNSIPRGKLPMTFPRTSGQCPIYYSQFNTGRPHVLSDAQDTVYETEVTGQNKFVARYVDSKTGPLYPFGYGLSYTTFKYGDDMELQYQPPTSASAEDKGKITVTLSISAACNDAVAGKEVVEVVQVYTSAPPYTTSPVLRRLKGFQLLKFEMPLSCPPEREVTKSAEVVLDVYEALGFYDSHLDYIIPEGEHRIRIARHGVVHDSETDDFREVKFTYPPQ